MFTRQQCIEKLIASAPYIRKVYGVKALCLFGSVARGDNGNNSDIDVLVEMPPHMNLLAGLKAFLEDRLGGSVDLIRRHDHLSPFFLAQIEKDGIYVIQ